MMMFLVSTADQMLHLDAAPTRGERFEATQEVRGLKVIDPGVFLVPVQVLAMVSWPNPILARDQLWQFTYLQSPLCS